MATKSNSSNPLFTRSEKFRIKKKIRHKIKGAARKGLSALFGIPLSRGLGAASTSSSRRPARARSTTASSGVRAEVMEALRDQGYNAATVKKMAAGIKSGDDFESAFRRVMQRNPGELIIFGNPATCYTKQGVSRARRKNILIPPDILSGFQWGLGSQLFNSLQKGQRKHRGTKKGTKNPGHRHNAKCGDQFCFHGAFNEKADAVKKEKSTPGSFVRPANFPPYSISDRRYIVLTPRQKSKKQNPDTLDRAADLFRTFHHRDESGVYEMQRSAKQRKDFTILGPLVAIGVNREKYLEMQRGITARAGKKSWDDYRVEQWDKLPHLALMTGPQVAFVKRVLEDPKQYLAKCPQLASSPNGRQLYAITPDPPDLSFLRDFDTDASKDFIDLGDATFVVYVAKKPDTANEWVHELGEDGGYPPRLNYNRLARELFFTGGTYTVEGPGILN